MKTDVSHIEATRKNWLLHAACCQLCHEYAFVLIDATPCEPGQVLYDEYQSAISAHRDLEELEAKPCDM